MSSGQDGGTEMAWPLMVNQRPATWLAKLGLLADKVTLTRPAAGNRKRNVPVLIYVTARGLAGLAAARVMTG